MQCLFTKRVATSLQILFSTNVVVKTELFVNVFIKKIYIFQYLLVFFCIFDMNKIIFDLQSPEKDRFVFFLNFSISMIHTKITNTIEIIHTFRHM